MAPEDPEFDVVVAGSGAAGMTAALTAARQGLSVVVIEKTAYFGGSTARSGGGVWVPCNAVLAKAGVGDTREQASAYLAHVAGDCVTPGRQRALLEHGPAMLDLVRSAAPVDFAWVPGYADYYPEAPGGMACGRTIEPVPLDGRILGDEVKRLNPPYLPAPDGMAITAADYRWLSLGTRHPRAVWTTAKIAGRMAKTKALHRRTMTLGQALSAGLRAGLAAAGIPLWLDTPLTGLVVGQGRVTGARVTREGQPGVLRARRGVLVATGGFERNAAMRAEYQRQPIGTDWTVGSPGNTGDGILAGQEAGAALDLMDDAWWGPSIPLTGGPFFCLSERSLPGCILVNAAGERFVNEAAPYVDAVHAMYDKHTDDKPHIPAWLILDQRYRNRYVFAGLPPRKPLPRRWYAAGAVFRAGTLADLAGQAGIAADGLAETVARFNGFAAAGRDEEFGRGDSAYDRYYGDPRCRPNPNLAPLAKPPFYAVKIVPGDLGTKGGLRTDERARVLRQDGTAIAGLYAAGNASAAVMGHSYAGAGATIGPAMTFGYVAALDMAAAGNS
ncbi:MAG TPA: 3-oxosteroid 1-dehydrogenase [Streptosporangiaceae bacterium]|nr:3-oxosteroid 1-dehydrogenase [Streptosporangiaceae bacterium]